MISSTGENLNILICCQHSLLHEWMTFFSYYSIKTYLPDAKLAISCERHNLHHSLFGWARKLNLNFEYHKPKTKLDYLNDFIFKKKLQIPCLIIEPDIICVRECNENFLDLSKNQKQNEFFVVSDFEKKHFEDSVLYSQAKNNNISNFVSYSDGWGTFNLTTWINKNDYPFNPFYKFNKSLLSLNERRIDELWQSATNIFSVLFRG